MQVIDDPGKWGGVKESFQQGLQQLLNFKMGQMQQRHQQAETYKGLKSIPGISDEQAWGLSTLPQQSLGIVLKQLMQAPEKAIYAQNMKTLAGGLSGGQPPVPSQMAQSPMGMGQPSMGIDQFRTQEVPEGFLENISPEGQQLPPSGMQFQGPSQQPITTQPRQGMSSILEGLNFEGMTPEHQRSVLDIAMKQEANQIAREKTASAQELARQKLAQAGQQHKETLENAKERTAILKKKGEQLAEHREKDLLQKRELKEKELDQKLVEASKNRVFPSIQAANQTINNEHKIQSNLKELKMMNRTGELLQGKNLMILDKLGLKNFFVAGNPMTQIAQKNMKQLSTYLVRESGLGSSMSNFIWQSLESALPSLYNNQEGMEGIIKGLEYTSKSKEEEAKIYRNVVKEYESRGEPIPMTIGEEVDARKEKVRQFYNNKKLAVIGEALAKTVPQLNPNKWPQGQKVRFHGYPYQLRGRAWFPLEQEEA